jgi:flagellar hook-basal body complex protein FliE
MIDSIKGIGSLPTLEQINKAQPAGGTEKVSKGGSFSEMLSSALQEVGQLQVEADQKIESVTTGKGNVSTHEAMIALEKADVAFQLMSTIKSKIVKAYEEVLRTQV